MTRQRANLAPLWSSSRKWRMKYTPIAEVPCHGGVKKLFEFPNGYKASVIRHSFSYGSELGLWELAVVNKSGNLDYTTPITDDVLGNLTEEQVEETLTKISELPSI